MCEINENLSSQLHTRNYKHVIYKPKQAFKWTKGCWRIDQGFGKRMGKDDGSKEYRVTGKIFSSEAHN